jgi:methionine transaminase
LKRVTTPTTISKLPRTGTTIFSLMSALAQQHDAVNLGQGFPDFDCDPRLLDLMNAAMRAGLNQYAPMAGVAALREAIAQKVETLYGRRYDVADEVTVTAGATQAIQTAVSAITHPGDEVIIFEPVYDSYEPVIRLNGGVPVYARLRYPLHKPDWREVSALITPRTRAIIINTPHNPTATAWSAQDMHSLAEVTRNTNILVISDEVYEHIIFDGYRHESVARFPELAERAFVISSFGKTYHITGWKVAYCLAPRPLAAEFRKAHQFVVFAVHAPSQYAIAEYMKLDTHLSLSAFYQNKRDFFLERVRASRFEWLPCHGTYFVSASFAHMSDLGDMQYAQELTRDTGVASIPVSVFYNDAEDNKVLRFCFAKREATLERAAELLCKA